MADGTLDGVQLHVLSFLGSTWGRGEPRFPAEKVAAYTRKVAEYGGALTWDVPVQRNGVIDAAFLEQLKAAGRVLHPPASPENPGSTPRP